MSQVRQRSKREKTRLMDRNEFHLYSHTLALNSLCFKLQITLGGKALNTQIIHQKNTYHLSAFKFLDETHFKGLICFLAWGKYSLSNIDPHLFTCFIGICGLHGYHQAVYYWIQVAFRILNASFIRSSPTTAISWTNSYLADNTNLLWNAFFMLQVRQMKRFFFFF